MVDLDLLRQAGDEAVALVEQVVGRLPRALCRGDRAGCSAAMLRASVLTSATVARNSALTHACGRPAPAGLGEARRQVGGARQHHLPRRPVGRPAGRGRQGVQEARHGMAQPGLAGRNTRSSAPSCVSRAASIAASRV
jgi:hypothetical protein